jgi:hypothetical protein
VFLLEQLSHFSFSNPPCFGSTTASRLSPAVRGPDPTAGVEAAHPLAERIIMDIVRRWRPHDQVERGKCLRQRAVPYEIVLNSQHDRLSQDKSNRCLSALLAKADGSPKNKATTKRLSRVRTSILDE